jgi:thiamine pyrophosphate-dependent acetolactate synthase large subunit-like protein
MEQEIKPYHLEQKFWTPVQPTALPADALPIITSLLMQAREPLCITGYGGRNPQAVESLVALADVVKGLRVLDTGGSDLCFPANHRGWLSSRFGVHDAIRSADVILVLSCDIPWVNTRCKPSQSARIIHIDTDPLKQIPVFYIDAEARYRADPAIACCQLVEHIRSDSTLSQLSQSLQFEDRWEALGRSHGRLLDSIREAARPNKDGSYGTAYLCSLIRQLASSDSIYAIEAVTNTPIVADQIQASLPGQWLNCGGGGLGWSSGGALGIKLASDAIQGDRPKKMVIQIVGDGSFMFSIPGSAFWISHRYKIPILTIVLNNRGEFPSLSCSASLPWWY